MTARVFISYRSSDGTDKATALARDLDALFGQDQIFLDKEDLPAGSRWRDEIRRALGSAPILLVLVTPNYLGARAADGQRLIDRADDPVRSELEAGVAANAHVIPLLCDGVVQTPGKAELPPPFDQLAERTWRRLRAYDWRQDVGRLAGDLGQLGLVAREGATIANAIPSRPAGLLDPELAAAIDRQRSRRPLLVAGALVVAGVAGFAAWRWQEQRAASLAGTWRARIGARGGTSSRNGEVMMVEVTHEARKVSFKSSAVDVELGREWQNHRDYWKQRHGTDLKQVVYVGEGELREEGDESPASGVPRGPRQVIAVVRVEVPGSPETIDTGSLRAVIEPDGNRLHGKLFLNGERGERFVDLQRER